MKTKKNTIKLTEGELKKIISESVKRVLKENNDRPLTQLCFALINGNLKSNIEVYEGDFEGSIDVTVTFNGGEINASGYGYEDGDDFELASATIQWNGGTAYVSEGEPIASKLSKTISLLMQDRGDVTMESKIKRCVSESVKKMLRENDDFQPHGYRGTSNWGGLEMQISDSGDAARLRNSVTNQVSDWLEIQFDEDGVAYVTDENGNEERLCDYMRY